MWINYGLTRMYGASLFVSTKSGEVHYSNRFLDSGTSKVASLMQGIGADITD